MANTLFPDGGGDDAGDGALPGFGASVTAGGALPDAGWTIGSPLLNIQDPYSQTIVYGSSQWVNVPVSAVLNADGTAVSVTQYGVEVGLAGASGVISYLPASWLTVSGSTAYGAAFGGTYAAVYLSPAPVTSSRVYLRIGGTLILECPALLRVQG